MTNINNNQSCEQCGTPAQGFESVHLVSDQQAQFLCLKCYNQQISKRFGLDFKHLDFPPVTLKDINEKEHEFRFTTRLIGDLKVMQATEIRDDAPEGYQLKVIGESKQNNVELYLKLFTKVCRNLARKHIEMGKFGWEISKEDIVRGQIDCDLESEEHKPMLVIDGINISWDEFARMLMTYEGFDFRLEIFDKSEDS